jgi:hypothetical protein
VPIAAKPKRIQPLNHSIRMIRAVPFRSLAHQPESQVFSITIRDIMEEQKRTDKPEVDIDPIDIPEEYRDLAEFFSKKAADTLPEHRLLDYCIILEEGVSESQLGLLLLYRISNKELDLCKIYIDDNLRKGFIKASSVPFGSPVLFVQKPGRGLRFCIDYRQLNVLTKKD